MASIFRGAFLTIAATSARNSSEGAIFDTSSPPLRIFFVQEDTDTSCQIAAVRAQYVNPLNYLGCADAHLNKRGWTFQELLLSPRTVHFTGNQLYWRCHHHIASEDGSLEAENERRYSAFLGPPYLAGSKTGTLIRDHGIYLWREWVNVYSSRALTYPGDKFAAIAGAISYYNDLTHKILVFGLWESTLLFDLVWYLYVPATRDDGYHRPSNLDIAPSWSWFSVEGEITTVYSSDYYQVTKTRILEWFVEWDGTPYTSKLLSTRLLVQGPILPARFVDNLGSQGAVIVEVQFEEPTKSPIVYLALSRPLQPPSVANNFHLDYSDPRAERNLFALSLFCDSLGTTTFLLVSASTLVPGDFRRVGVGRVDKDQEKGAFDSAPVETLDLV
ncbi:hypothetical protein BKA65DRAFT_113864 [Rhexocercosporidium sp. MPI-PUGE-AT-0058]|nr:hypothetical protein BKA65DRAFT_113864 [Rhexocercosporidium sp. MPI-PUGE-AT-0058]